jgi:quercetin 2,3-dioxygenase
MAIHIHHADDRGKGDYEWLKTRYSFSFANWYNPARMGFGALRVINDDSIAPASGFPPHSHRDMEIITIVTKGTLTHKDSLGNVGTVRSGEVQVMSAGTGVTHSEYNASDTEELQLFQIWITPERPGVSPRYDQKDYPKAAGIITLVGPTGSGELLTINQQAHISRALVPAGGLLEYTLKDHAHGLYAFVVSGTPTVAGIALTPRDALGITETTTVTLSSNEPAELLLFEVPMSLQD